MTYTHESGICEPQTAYSFMISYPPKKEPVLKPCPFCGSKNVELSQDGYGSWAVECHGYACHAYVTNAKWRCERKEDAIALWNRRKEDEE